MADNTVLTATPRDRVGKGPARAARRAGDIPAVVYGDSKPPLTVVIEARELIRHLKTGGFFNTLFDLKVGDESHRVLAREVQMHPVTDAPEHVDFLRVSAGTAVTVEVPVEFVNETDCPGLRVGGVLNVVRYAIEVSCQPDSIPSAITVDLAAAELGDSLHISAVALPPGVTPVITDRDFTIATIAAPTAAPVEDAEGEDAETEGDAETAAGEGAEPAGDGSTDET